MRSSLIVRSDETTSRPCSIQAATTGQTGPLQGRAVLMLDPKSFTDPDEMRQLRSLMTERCPSLHQLPTITLWGVVIDGDGALRMRGLLSSHPKFINTPVITGPI